METKQKTLAECKDEVAKKYGFDSFNQLIKAYIINLDYVVLNSRIDEAAELYAGQTKQSEPVSIDIIDEAVRFRDNFDYTSCLTSTGIKTGEAVMNSFIAGAKWQSQQQSANAELKKQKEELVELIKIAQNNIPVGGSKQSQERYLNFMERSTEILKQIENTQPKN